MRHDMAVFSCFFGLDSCGSFCGHTLHTTDVAPLQSKLAPDASFASRGKGSCPLHCAVAVTAGDAKHQALDFQYSLRAKQPDWRGERGCS